MPTPGKITPSIVVTITLDVWFVGCVLYQRKCKHCPPQSKSLIFDSLHLILLPPSNTVSSFRGNCSLCQHQAWLQHISVSGVCSECGLIHRRPSNLRLLPVCTPSRKSVMRASTAATFLPSSPPEKAFSPPFLRSPPQAVTRIHDSPLKISPSSWCRLWEGQKRTREFCGQPESRLNSGRL